MLYGYVKGGFASRVVGHLETLGSHMLSNEPEPQEDWVNIQGGAIGARIKKVIKNKLYLNTQDRPETLNPEYYLVTDDNYEKELKKRALKLYETLPEIRALRQAEQDRYL